MSSETESEFIRVRLRNFGPVEEAEIKVRPLTLFIGRNSVGKSLVAELIWVLSKSLPDSVSLLGKFHKRSMEVFRGYDPLGILYEKIQRGEEEVTDYIKIVSELLIDLLGEAFAEGLERELREIFGEINKLIRIGADRAEIDIETILGGKSISSIAFMIKDNKVSLQKYSPNKKFLETLKITTPYPKHLVIQRDKEEIYGGTIYSINDLIREVIANIIYHYSLETFPLLFRTTNNLFLSDSRAGVIKILLRPYPRISWIRGVGGVEADFSETYFELVDVFEKKDFNKELKGSLDEVLDELGCRVEVKREAGVPGIYLYMWSGQILNLAEAPSGIREILLPLLALASKRHTLVIIEEPEAHLHPKAQRSLAKLIARAINTDKYVLITTHSDYILSQIENLIKLSAKSGGDIRRLGFDPLDAIDPEDVSVYLFRLERDRSKVFVEEIPVTHEGIPQDEFAKIVEEILEERSRIEIS
jgi:predicted ATPase